MQTLKWWLAFLAYALCWLIGTAWWYILHPVRMIQIEVGNVADWGVRNMKRMVAYLPILALVLALPVCACAAGNETHLYGPQGRYQGRATTNSANPSQQSVYDAKGNYVGRVMTGPDGTTRVYDQHGRFKGSRPPDRQTHQKK